MKKIVFLFLLFSHQLFSQDPEFAQYYAAPLMINPAFVGEADCYRVGLLSRLQWTGLTGGPFNTTLAFGELNHPDLRSAFGIIALRDGMSGARITSTELSALYSFMAPVSKQVNFKFGLQGTFVSRNINYNNLLFEDQFSGATLVNPATYDPVTQFDRVIYGDFSAGVAMFGEDTYWIGISAYHLNQPRQNFYVIESRLPMKVSLHGGYCFYTGSSYYKEKKTKIIPTFLYKGQSRFDQLDVGAYFIKSSFLAGLWYRGILFKEDKGIRNSDAVSVQLGFKNKKTSFIYSYDITTSRLHIRNTLGSHELSIIYDFCSRWPKKKKPVMKRLPCPKF